MSESLVFKKKLFFYRYKYFLLQKKPMPINTKMKLFIGISVAVALVIIITVTTLYVPNIINDKTTNFTTTITPGNMTNQMQEGYEYEMVGGGEGGSGEIDGFTQ
ncbi:hypothetical protein CDIK_0253 [Cucumispora dikerogammari]|nr:hypothetical protein CDIK_0253 [Cucumispora dikerogammari]